MINQGDMLGKTLVIGIIILLLCVFITPAIGINNNDDTTPPITTISFDPSEPDGENDWYVNDVNVTLSATDDLSGVKEINYQIDGGSVQTVPREVATFIVTADSLMHTIIYWAVDNVGNIEPDNTINFKQDQTPPDIELEWEIIGGNQWQGWDFLFTVNAKDYCSGMNRVEFYWNDILQKTVYGSGPTYQWEFRYWRILNIIISATAFDNAGNSITQETYNNPHRQISYNQPKIKQQSLTLLFLKLINRFPLLEVFLRAMNLLR